MKTCSVENCSNKHYARGCCAHHYYQLPDRKEVLLKNNKEYVKNNREKLKEKGRQKYQLNKDVLKEKSKKYREEHRESYLCYMKEWHKNNKDKDQKWKEDNRDKINNSARKSYHRNREKCIARNSKYYMERAEKDLNFRLRINLRKRIGSVLLGNIKAGSAVKDLGCSIDELRIYIESKFKPGMSWDNWSRTGWHLDHIRPLSSFDLTDRQQYLEACNFKNLQPLWAEDNLKKGNKLEGV